MAIKTRPENAPVEDFLNAISNDKRRADAKQLAEIMHEATGEPAVMWGTSIVGYGTYSYKYASGQEGDWMRVGFSPRKQALVLYGLQDGKADVSKLGKTKLGKGCVYVNKLEDIDLTELKKLITTAFQAKGEYEKE